MKVRQCTALSGPLEHVCGKMCGCGRIDVATSDESNSILVK